MKDLTVSNIERQNVLNNRFAVDEIQKRLDISGMFFEGEYWLTKKMVADFYAVDISTIDRYLGSNSEELKHNGYVLCKGKSLKEFKLQFAHLINEASKITQLGLFNFRAFLNIGMLQAFSWSGSSQRRQNPPPPQAFSWSGSSSEGEGSKTAAGMRLFSALQETNPPPRPQE